MEAGDFFFRPFDKSDRARYNRATTTSVILQGGVQFPTGGKAREPKGMIR